MSGWKYSIDVGKNTRAQANSTKKLDDELQVPHRLHLYVKSG